jgi:methionine-rich copper-binding protein CopC
VKILTVLTTALLLALPVLLPAHPHVEKSEPADHSTATTAPQKLMLAFNEAVIVTALTIRRGTDKPQPLGPLAKDAARQQSYALPVLAPGDYTVKWRAMGADSHLMSGQLSFRVGAQ